MILNRSSGPDEPTNLDNLDDLLEEDHKTSKIKYIFIFITIFLVIVGLFLYPRVSRDSNAELPIIYADDRASKVAPVDPGGMIIANMDKAIYDNFAEQKANPSKGEQILPKPEEPIALRPLEKEVPIEPPRESNKVRESNTVKEPPSIKVPKPIDDSVIKNNELNKKLAEIFAQEAKASPQKMTVTTPKGSNLKIQLSAYRSMREAQQAWIHLSKKYPKHLSRLQSVISVRQVVGKGKLYILQAGYISDIGKAHNLCKSLTAAGQSCSLVK